MRKKSNLRLNLYVTEYRFGSKTEFNDSKNINDVIPQR